MFYQRYKITCSAKPQHIIFHKINGCIKDYDGS